MPVLNANRPIDRCGNTVANPNAKKCSTIQPVKTDPEADMYFATGLGVFFVVAVLVITIMYFRSNRRK
jgi:hypothetical protein